MPTLRNQSHSGNEDGTVKILPKQQQWPKAGKSMLGL